MLVTLHGETFGLGERQDHGLGGLLEVVDGPAMPERHQRDRGPVVLGGQPAMG